MTVQTRFALAAPDASRAAHEVALAALNAIRLTDDHIRHGFGFLIAADFETPGAAAGRLLAYASAEGLYPADVAAQAIAIRAAWLHDFIADGGDPEFGWAYERFACAAITLEDLRGLEGPEEPEDFPLDDEIPW
ncbi:MAG TPA: hypothetical protein VF463_18850 [Sphingobium sp.]